MIGYHYVIGTNGGIEIGRPLNMAGAHAQGYNKYSIGICLVGGCNKDGNAIDNFTRKQLLALKGLVELLIIAFHPAIIQGHRDINPHKECPCFDVAWWMEKEKLWEN